MLSAGRGHHLPLPGQPRVQPAGLQPPGEQGSGRDRGVDGVQHLVHEAVLQRPAHREFCCRVILGQILQTHFISLRVGNETSVKYQNFYFFPLRTLEQFLFQSYDQELSFCVDCGAPLWTHAVVPPSSRPLFGLACESFLFFLFFQGVRGHRAGAAHNQQILQPGGDHSGERRLKIVSSLFSYVRTAAGGDWTSSSEVSLRPFSVYRLLKKNKRTNVTHVSTLCSGTSPRRCPPPCRRTLRPSSTRSTWPTTPWTTRVRHRALVWVELDFLPVSHLLCVRRRCVQPDPADVSPQQRTSAPQPLQDLPHVQRFGPLPFYTAPP